MVHVNLMTRKRRQHQLLIPLLISFSFLGLAILLSPFFAEYRAEPRPLLVEEKEIIVAVLSRVEQKDPRLSLSVAHLLERIRDDRHETLLKKDASPLVFQADGTLVFSDGFFSADSATQENSLAELVSSLAFKDPPLKGRLLSH